MGYIGKIPSAVPLTSADITDNVITSAKIVDGTITNTDIASSIITGQTAETSIAGGDQILIYDDSATALRKMTRTNFVSGLGAAAGQVIQVLGATDQTQRNTSSSTYVTASNGLSVTITPSSSSNKMFIIINTGTANGLSLSIFRDSTNLGSSASTYGFGYIDGVAQAIGCISVLDSPSTTSAITYQLYFKSDTGGNVYINNNNSKGSITVMEVKG